MFRGEFVRRNVARSIGTVAEAVTLAVPLVAHLLLSIGRSLLGCFAASEDLPFIVGFQGKGRIYILVLDDLSLLLAILILILLVELALRACWGGLANNLEAHRELEVEAFKF